MEPTKALAPNTPEYSEEGIDMASLCRTVLKVVARLEEQQYTASENRQAAVSQHDDLPDLASVRRTSQG